MSQLAFGLSEFSSDFFTFFADGVYILIVAAVFSGKFCLVVGNGNLHIVVLSLESLMFELKPFDYRCIFADVVFEFYL
jgi:hypothetical protein